MLNPEKETELYRCIGTLEMIVQALYDTDLDIEMDNLKEIETVDDFRKCEDTMATYQLGYLMGMDYSIQVINKFKEWLEQMEGL